MKKLNVVIANDQTLVSAALRTFIENCHGIEVLGSVRLGPAARTFIARKKPRLLFLFLAVRGFEGLDQAERLLRAFPKLPAIALIVNNSPEYVSRALRIGLRAVLPQTAKPSEFEKAVRASTNGDVYVSPELPRPNGEKTAFEKLTPRQRSVLKLMAEGNSTKQVAKALKLSPKTVEFHRARLMERLNIYDVPGLVRLAVRVGLVSIDQ